MNGFQDFPTTPASTNPLPPVPPSSYPPLPSPSQNPTLLTEPIARSLSCTAIPDELLQSRLRSILLCRVDILSVVPVASRNVLAANADGARPGSTLATTVGEDVVGGERDAAVLAVL